MMTTLSDALNAYNKKFSDGFPTIPLLNNGDEWCINVIKRCIEANKDVYEMGYLDDDPDILY